MVKAWQWAHLTLALHACTLQRLTASQFPLDELYLNIYFEEGVYENGLNAESITSFESFFAEHTKQYTSQQLQECKLHSVEESIYEALYFRTLPNITNQGACTLQSSGCFEMQLSTTVEFHDSHHFESMDTQNFTDLVFYHTAMSLKTNTQAQNFITNINKDQNLKGIFDVTVNFFADEDPRDSVFVDEFGIGFDNEVLYRRKDDKSTMMILIEPSNGVFLISTVAILCGSLYLLCKSLMYDKQVDLLKFHTTSVSKAMASTKGATIGTLSEDNKTFGDGNVNPDDIIRNKSVSAETVQHSQREI